MYLNCALGVRCKVGPVSWSKNHLSSCRKSPTSDQLGLERGFNLILPQANTIHMCLQQVRLLSERNTMNIPRQQKSKVMVL